ncbi:MAG: RraA family protein [Candidatus Latescibacteria bacterium]|nr:RraA family protein [Candidatus Latescibacterota bacterium]
MSNKEISLSQMCQRYRRLYGGPIMDVLDQKGLHNQWLHRDIKPLLHDMVIAGPAVTVKAIRRPTWENVPPGPDLMEAIYPHCVLVWDPGNEDQSGHVGGVTANSIYAKGCQGVVVDGGIRDSYQHLRIPDWRCFCRYTSPLEQGYRTALLEVEKPLCISGSLTYVVQVNPGDFIFGDLDGVIVIPKDVIYEVLAKAEDIAAREQEGVEKIRSGTDARKVQEEYHIG